MATAIVYYSRHHGNTKKLLDAIARDNEVTLIDATASPVPCPGPQNFRPEPECVRPEDPL